MRAWLACALLVGLCVRIGWLTRDNRQAVQIAASVAVTAVALTALRTLQ